MMSTPAASVRMASAGKTQTHLKSNDQLKFGYLPNIVHAATFTPPCPAT